MFVATCSAKEMGEAEACDWSEPSPTESEAKVLTTLHAIDRHPEAYRRLTKRDPDEARRSYREYFNAYRGRY